jgi:hypothetical protein
MFQQLGAMLACHAIRPDGYQRSSAVEVPTLIPKARRSDIGGPARNGAAHLRHPVVRRNTLW